MRACVCVCACACVCACVCVCVCVCEVNRRREEKCYPLTSLLSVDCSLSTAFLHCNIMRG